MEINGRKVVSVWLALGAISYILALTIVLAKLAVLIYFANVIATLVLAVKFALASRARISSPGA